MDDSAAMALCGQVKSVLNDALRTIRLGLLEHTKDSRLLVQKKSEFVISSLSTVKSFEVICDETNNKETVSGVFLVTVIVEFIDHAGRNYAFTIST